MIRLRSIRTMIKSFFLIHYRLVIFISIIVALTTAFFHLLWYFQNQVFVSWVKPVQALYNEYGYIFPLTTTAVICFTLSVIFMFARNAGPMKYFDDLAKLEAKRRYGDFLFVRLLSQITRIKESELDGRRMISLDTITKVHDEIYAEIIKFRHDARKLFTPNEMEMAQPVEEAFKIENELIDKRYQHIKIGMEGLKKLIDC